MHPEVFLKGEDCPRASARAARQLGATAFGGPSKAPLSFKKSTVCDVLRSVSRLHNTPRHTTKEFYMKKHVAVVFAVLSGCGGGVATIDDRPSKSSQWLCSANETAIQCSAALPGQPGESGAYACKSGELSAACPETTLTVIPGAEKLIAKFGLSDKINKVQWACLLTGKHQRQCVQDLAAASRQLQDIGELPAANPIPGSTPGANNPTGTPTGSPPTVPASCDPKAWEPYFKERSTHEYRNAKVDIDFPREIFDVSANFNNLAIESASLPANPGKPSCHEGEWSMREKAWMDAVLKGCTNLNNAILVMCQQAANYAPKAGACAPTGSW